MDDYPGFTWKSIAIPLILGLAMLFSCENDISKVRELTDVETLPAVHATDIVTIYSDSAVVRLKITAPELLEFAESEDQSPYIEFPQGLQAIFYNKNQSIESTLEAQYAIFDKKVEVFTARENVVVKNFAEKQELYAEYLIWDKVKEEISSDKFVKIVTEDGVTYGENGFISDQNFTNFRILNSRGTLNVEDDFSKKPIPNE